VPFGPEALEALSLLAIMPADVEGQFTNPINPSPGTKMEVVCIPPSSASPLDSDVDIGNDAAGDGNPSLLLKRKSSAKALRRTQSATQMNRNHSGKQLQRSTSFLYFPDPNQEPKRKSQVGRAVIDPHGRLRTFSVDTGDANGMEAGAASSCDSYHAVAFCVEVCPTISGAHRFNALFLEQPLENWRVLCTPYSDGDDIAPAGPRVRTSSSGTSGGSSRHAVTTLSKSPNNPDGSFGSKSDGGVIISIPPMFHPSQNSPMLHPLYNPPMFHPL
jgi:hypothetical protein